MGFQKQFFGVLSVLVLGMGICGGAEASSIFTNKVQNIATTQAVKNNVLTAQQANAVKGGRYNPKH